MTGESEDPMTGAREVYKSTYTIVLPTSYIFRMYNIGADEKEFVSLEASYAHKWPRRGRAWLRGEL